MPQPTWQVVTIVEILRGDVTSGGTSGAISGATDEVTSGATDEVTSGATDEVTSGAMVVIIPK